MGEFSRRSALGLGALAMLAGCGTQSEAVVPAAATPQVPRRVGTVWTAHADGPIPATGDEGLPITPILAGSSVPPAVREGFLVGNLPADRAAAAYVTQRLDTRVNRVGARFAFDPGADSGAVALLAWTGEAVLNGHGHVVITPARWVAGVVIANEVVEIASDDFARPLPQDGSVLAADAVFAGTTLTLALPDGSRRAISDTRFAAPGGVVAGWEFYKNTADSADVRFAETWAG